MLGIFIVVAKSRPLVGPVRRVLTAIQARRRYGAGTKMATPSATHAVSTSNYTAYVAGLSMPLVLPVV